VGYFNDIANGIFSSSVVECENFYDEKQHSNKVLPFGATAVLDTNKAVLQRYSTRTFCESVYFVLSFFSSYIFALTLVNF